MYMLQAAIQLNPYIETRPGYTDTFLRDLDTDRIISIYELNPDMQTTVSFLSFKQFQKLEHYTQTDIQTPLKALPGRIRPDEHQITSVLAVLSWSRLDRLRTLQFSKW